MPRRESEGERFEGSSVQQFPDRDRSCSGAVQDRSKSFGTAACESDFLNSGGQQRTSDVGRAVGSMGEGVKGPPFVRSFAETQMNFPLRNVRQRQSDANGSGCQPRRSASVSPPDPAGTEEFLEDPGVELADLLDAPAERPWDVTGGVSHQAQVRQEKEVGIGSAPTAGLGEVIRVDNGGSAVRVEVPAGDSPGLEKTASFEWRGSLGTWTGLSFQEGAAEGGLRQEVLREEKGECKELIPFGGFLDGETAQFSSGFESDFEELFVRPRGLLPWNDEEGLPLELDSEPNEHAFVSTDRNENGSGGMAIEQKSGARLAVLGEALMCSVCAFGVRLSPGEEAYRVVKALEFNPETREHKICPFFEDAETGAFWADLSKLETRILQHDEFDERGNPPESVHARRKKRKGGEWKRDRGGEGRSDRNDKETEKWGSESMGRTPRIVRGARNVDVFAQGVGFNALRRRAPVEPPGFTPEEHARAVDLAPSGFRFVYETEPEPSALTLHGCQRHLFGIPPEPVDGSRTRQGQLVPDQVLHGSISDLFR